ncbi:MAG: hypothetical protein H6505_02445 [Calditrichaeota bacterium]|nr:hypothetical protein [Calditrichota bacterium]
MFGKAGIGRYAGIAVVGVMLVMTGVAAALSYYQQFSTSGTFIENFYAAATTNHYVWAKAPPSGTITSSLQQNIEGAWYNAASVNVHNGAQDCDVGIVNQGEWCRVRSVVQAWSGSAIVGAWDYTPPQTYMVCDQGGGN